MKFFDETVGHGGRGLKKEGKAKIKLVATDWSSERVKTKISPEP